MVSKSNERKMVGPDRAIEKVTSILGTMNIGQSSPTVIFDQQVQHPYSHYARPAKALTTFEGGVERKSKRWSSFDEGIANLQRGDSGDEPFTETHDESATTDGIVAEATVPIPPTDVKLDFTNFEAP